MAIAEGTLGRLYEGALESIAVSDEVENTQVFRQLFPK